MWTVWKRAISREGCTTHTNDPHGSTYDGSDNKCSGLSNDERIALAGGLSLAAVILLLVIGIWVGRYIRKRRKAARIQNESAARIQDEKRNSATTPFLLPRARMPWGAKRDSNMTSKADKLSSRSSDSDESSLYDPQSSGSSFGSRSPGDGGTSPNLESSEESFKTARQFFELPRLSADGKLLPPRPPPKRPARPSNVNLDKYTPLPVRSPPRAHSQPLLARAQAAAYVQVPASQPTDIGASDRPLSPPPLHDVPLSPLPLHDAPLSPPPLHDPPLSPPPVHEAPLSPTMDYPLSPPPRGASLPLLSPELASDQLVLPPLRRLSPMPSLTSLPIEPSTPISPLPVTPTSATPEHLGSWMSSLHLEKGQSDHSSDEDYFYSADESRLRGEGVV